MLLLLLIHSQVNINLPLHKNSKFKGNIKHKLKDNFKANFKGTFEANFMANFKDNTFKEKITRRTIGVHGYNLLLNELSIAILWYNMLSNIRYLVSSFAISWYKVLFNAFWFLM